MITTPVQSEAYVPSVEDDRTCVGCAYNLRGLLVTGNCPECGCPVEQSLHGNELWHSDPRWLWILRWGMTLMLALTVTGLLWHVATQFMNIQFDGVLHLYIFAMVSSSGFAVILACLITAREPRSLGNSSWFSIQVAVRILLILSHVLGCTAILILVTTTDVNRYFVAMGIYGLLYLCGVTGSILLMIMLRGYAKRMNADFIAKWLLFHAVTAALMGLPVAFMQIQGSLGFFLNWNASEWWYEWVMNFRNFGYPIDTLIFLPLAIIYHCKLERARLRAIAIRSTKTAY